MIVFFIMLVVNGNFFFAEWNASVGRFDRKSNETALVLKVSRIYNNTLSVSL